MYSIAEVVTPSRTGKDGRLKFIAALNMMQDCLEMWLSSENYFRNYFLANNISQLLVSRQVCVLRVPLFGEKLTITTSVFECTGSYGYRNTIICDEDGSICYVTWSTGAFINHDTGRLAKIPPEITGALVIDPKFDMEYLDRKIVAPESGYIEYEPIEVKKYDIDYNLHMNNSQYVRIASEFLPEEFDVKRFRVEYRSPAKYKDKLYPKILKVNDDRIFIILMNEKKRENTVMEFLNK